jgi:hypothetical protein
VNLHLTDKIVLAILDRDGTAGIRQLQAAAVVAHRTGYPDAAEAFWRLYKPLRAASAKREG